MSATTALVTPQELLIDGMRALQVAIDPAASAKLIDFVTLLAKWNRTHNLTAIREPSQMITHHVLDALAVVPHLPARASLTVLDVGTGGGVPGIPLAITRPGWRVTLLDSNHKKAAFLRQAKLELGLPNVDIVVSRVEEYRPAQRFDVVISRAFSDLRTFVDGSLSSVADDGWLVAMKGVMPDEEIAALPATVKLEATPALVVPGLAASRHLVVMRPDIHSA